MSITYLWDAISILDIIKYMNRSKTKNRKDRPVFEGIRKPTAPPTRKFGSEAPKEKRTPSLRKSKYKKPVEVDE